jgi:putative transposase
MLAYTWHGAGDVQSVKARGPGARRQPSPPGVGTDPHDDRVRPGLPWEQHHTCYPARILATHMSHSYSNIYVHAVYSTKDRKDSIPSEFEKRLYSFIASVAHGNKIPLLAAGGMPDHTHLLFLLPATISLASAINMFKTNSSRFLHERGLIFQWQNGYGAFSVSFSQLDTVTAYIRNQPDHHKKMTFEQEFLALLKKAGISYDPKYVLG